MGSARAGSHASANELRGQLYSVESSERRAVAGRGAQESSERYNRKIRELDEIDHTTTR